MAVSSRLVVLESGIAAPYSGDRAHRDTETRRDTQRQTHRNTETETQTDHLRTHACANPLAREH
eukprot:14758820-Alexandrium_andersonii.AAC.1